MKPEQQRKVVAAGELPRAAEPAPVVDAITAHSPAKIAADDDRMFDKIKAQLDAAPALRRRVADYLAETSAAASAAAE